MKTFTIAIFALIIAVLVVWGSVAGMKAIDRYNSPVARAERKAKAEQRAEAERRQQEELSKKAVRDAEAARQSQLEREKTRKMVGQAIVGLIAFLLCLVVYFVPYLIAYRRSHNNAEAILVVNLFLGWTFLGWVGALTWAVIRPCKSEMGSQ